MRSRTWIIACLVIAAAMWGSFSLTSAALDHGSTASQTPAMADSLMRLRSALESDLRQLEIATAGYARSDGLAEFARGRNRRYVAATLDAVALENLQVDLVWLRNSAGRGLVLLERTPGERTVRNASRELASALRAHAALIDAHAAGPASWQMIRLPRGVLAFSAAPIARGGNPRDAAGGLLFGRYLGADAIARLAQTSQLPVELTVLGADSPSAAQIPEPARAWLTSGTAAPADFAYADDHGLLRGHVRLDDLAGRPVAILSTSLPGDALPYDRRIMIALIASLLTGLALLVLLLLASLARSRRARAATEHRYQTVVQQLEECIVLAQATTGRIVETSPTVARLLGYKPAEMLSKTLQEIFLGLTDDELERARRREASGSREFTMCGKDGCQIQVEATMSALTLADEPLVCLVARDITARKNAERQRSEHQRRLTHLARRDALTGLPNRLELQRRLPRLLAHADRRGTLLALLYIDLDHFKNINDSLGHGSGDVLLKAVADRLRGAVSKRDMVVRMGGDEFVVAATRLPDQAAVEAITRRLRDRVREPLVIDRTVLNVTPSMGISIYPRDGGNLQDLLKHADIALYKAKDLGRNNHQFFAPEMIDRLTERLALEKDLRGAIGTGQLFLVYQPSFDLHSGLPTALEALLRWDHPIMGFIPPTQFIPVAEQSGLISEIGEFVLRGVCMQIAAWQREGLPVLPVAVNVSPRQFERSEFVASTTQIAREYGIDPSLIHLELTEGAIMQNTDAHLNALRTLREQGSRILIDDFGTGYSSLSYLKHLPIDSLKIDRAFVRDMATDRNDAALVRAIVGIAKSLGLHVVAEGVESVAQFDGLREVGCHTGQGFFFSRAMTSQDCRRFLANLASAKRQESGGGAQGAVRRPAKSCA